MVPMFAINLQVTSIAHSIINGYSVHMFYLSECFHFTLQFTFAEVTYTQTSLSWIIWITKTSWFFINLIIFSRVNFYRRKV